MLTKVLTGYCTFSLTLKIGRKAEPVDEVQKLNQISIGNPPQISLSWKLKLSKDGKQWDFENVFGNKRRLSSIYDY